MLRNSILYRRLWYVRKRNIRRIHIMLRISIAMLVLSFAVISVTGRFLPVLQNSAEMKVKSEVASVMKKIIEDTIKGSLQYDDYVTMDKKPEGSLASLELDKANLNILSEVVVSKLDEELESQGYSTIPICNFVPFFSIGIVQNGNIETRYFSEFTQVDISHMKHTIFLEVSNDVNFECSLFGGTTSVNITIPVAEAYIIGSGMKN